jgi:hypothetical protein
VIPGHPFFTERLDRQREEQRLILAGIPERMLQAVGIDRAKAVLPDPTGRVETTVRRLAGSLSAAVPQRVLEVVALHVEKQALEAWASEVDWSGWPNQVVKMAADEAYFI